MHRGIVLICAALAVTPPLAQAQGAAGFPSKPIRVVVPYPPGGGTDTLARALARQLTANLGQQVIVDNRGGAGGTIGMEIAAKAPADGHTIALALTAQLAVNPSLYKHLPYDPSKDFEPITLLARGAYVLLVHPSVPAKSVKALIELARAQPGTIDYASAGNGSGGHLAGELFKSMANVKMQHVPYKGGSQATVDLLAGNVDVGFEPYVTSKPYVDSGRLRALGVTAANRIPGVDIPTIAEAALPGYDAGVWYAFVAPARTPGAIVSKLNTELLRAAAHPDFRALLAKGAIEPIGSTPEELGKFMQTELVKWAKIVKGAGITID
jgi:tripartite-type tricarboxylate transporter receptor subunit TctC